MVTRLDKRIRLPRDAPFDYQLAMDRLRDYRAPRDKLRRLCESGEVVQVKRGLYVAGPVGNGPVGNGPVGNGPVGNGPAGNGPAGNGNGVDPLVVSGLLYGPSYVSLETALARHGMIPERVEEITCMATKRARAFDTPVGRFRYRPVPERAFAVGVARGTAGGGSYLLASPEKALCDRVAAARGVTAQREVRALLLEDLRLDESRLDELDGELIEAIAERYRRTPVTVFARWMSRRHARNASTVSP